MLNGRQLKLLQIVVENQDGIFGHDLAKALAVSARTVRNDIRVINKEDHKVLIQSSSKSGYFINQENSDHVRVLLDKHEDWYDETILRPAALLGELSFNLETDIYELEETLNLSASAIKKDWYSLKEFLDKNYHLVPFYLKGDRFFWNVNERHYRELLFKYMKDTVLGDKDNSETVLQFLLNGQLKTDQLEQTTRCVKESLAISGITISEQNSLLLSICITICIVRNINGYLVEPVEDSEMGFELSVFAAIQARSDYLFDADLPLLKLLFHTFKTLNGQSLGSEISSFTTLVYDEFCDEVFDKYAVPLRESQELHNLMVIHLEYMVRRMEQRFELKNPLKEEIKQKYPFAYEISMLMVHILFKYRQYYLSDDEISYLAIYVEHYLEKVQQRLKVVVVTSARQSIQDILSRWLDNYFHYQVEVVAVLPKKQYIRDFDSQQIDFVITLYEFVHDHKLEVYHLNNLPEPQDVIRLKELIRNIQMKRRILSILDEFIDPAKILLFPQVTTLDQVIRDLSMKLEERGNLSSGSQFYEDVILREENYPSNIAARFMIPHSLYTFASKQGLAIGFLKKPVSYNGSNISLVFLIALEPKRDYSVDLLFQFFKQIIHNDSYLDHLISAHSVDEFHQNFYDLKVFFG